MDDEPTLSERLEEELRVAREIQLSVLPSCPVAPGWTFDAKYLAAREVSGDFYDLLYHRMDTGRLELVIGDVTGKGVPAALMMATSRAVLRAEALARREPGRGAQPGQPDPDRGPPRAAVAERPTCRDRHTQRRGDLCQCRARPAAADSRGGAEARNPTGELFGEERLLDAAIAGARDGAAPAVSRSILDAVIGFTGGAAQADDLTLVVVQRKPH